MTVSMRLLLDVTVIGQRARLQHENWPRVELVDTERTLLVADT